MTENVCEADSILNEQKSFASKLNLIENKLFSLLTVRRNLDDDVVHARGRVHTVSYGMTTQKISCFTIFITGQKYLFHFGFCIVVSKE